jgi:hypothetical protein
LRRQEKVEDEEMPQEDMEETPQASAEVIFFSLSLVRYAVLCDSFRNRKAPTPPLGLAYF